MMLVQAHASGRYRHPGLVSITREKFAINRIKANHVRHMASHSKVDSTLAPAASLAAPLPELRVTPSRDLPARYAGASGDFNPIHLDLEFALSVGFPGPILHGLWTMAQVARAHLGPEGDPARLKRLSVEFRGVAVPEREIVVRSTVRETVGTRAILDTVVYQAGRRIIRKAQAEVTNAIGGL
jgi:acyl dehydratase